MKPRTSSVKTITVVLFDSDGRVVRRVPTPSTTTFLLNLKDGRYYDVVGPCNPHTFIVRTDKKPDLLSVECPCCHARVGWACGRGHTDPIHRARIVLALKNQRSEGSMNENEEKAAGGLPTQPPWPLVDVNDDGIRPAGPPDVCLYCRSKVGEPHGRECVIVTKRIEMLVRAKFDDLGDVTGVWRLDEPYSWTPDNSEFHKNESSWCAGNLVRAETPAGELGSVEWSAPGVWERLRTLYDADVDLCGILRFEFLRVVDDTPRRKLKGVQS